MENREKLRVLLPHWIEHNAEHAAEFEKWAACGEAGCEQIQQAAYYMEMANQALHEALTALGGATHTHAHSHADGSTHRHEHEHAHGAAHEHGHTR